MAFIILLWLICMCKTSFAIDTSGREFAISFMANYIEDKGNLQLLITTGDSPSEVSITLPLYDTRWNTRLNISAKNVSTIDIPIGIRGKHVAIENKTVYVNASADVTVIGVNKNSHTTDAFIALPIKSLGREYIAVTWKENPAIMIAAVTDSTRVRFEIPFDYLSSFTYNGQTYTGGSRFNVTLDRFNTFHLHSLVGDLSGTKITASTEISAFSGSTLAYVIDSIHFCCPDHLVEQLVPTQSWGKQYVTFTTPEREHGEYIRVIAAEDSTTYRFANKTYEVSEGTYNTHYVYIGEYYWVSSNKGISVVQFSKSSQPGESQGDPSMSIVVPVPLYQPEFTWSTITTTTGQFTNHIVIVSKLAYIAELYLDNLLIETQWIPVIGNDEYVVSFIYVQPGIHNMYNSNPTHTFLGVAMGNAHLESYAFPSGMRLAKINLPCDKSSSIAGDGIDNDCDERIDEELNNGIDDDNDGLIDEDLSMAVRDACIPRTADVIFVLDSSRSQGLSNFRRQKQYVQEFISNVPIGVDDFRVSVVSFSLTATLHFDYDTYLSNVSSLLSHLDNIKMDNGVSYIDKAFRAIRNDVLYSQTTLLNKSTYVVVLTDGLSSNSADAILSSKELKNAGVEIIAVGIGNQVSHEDLRNLASNTDRVLSITEPDVLRSIIRYRGMAECAGCYWTQTDVTILMEASTDVTIPHFYTHIDAAKSLLNALPIGTDMVRVSYSRFADELYQEFDFDDYMTTSTLIRAITVPRRLSRITSSSNISQALHSLANTGFETSNGHRLNAKKIAILFIDGNIKNDIAAKKSAIKLKDTCVTLVIVSSNISVNMTLLTQLASDSAFVYIVGTESYIDIDVLHSLVGMMRYETCDFD